MRGILIPSKFEAAEFLRVLRNPVKYHVDGVPCYLGELNDTTVTIAIIGMGAPHAGKNTEYFIKKVGPSELIITGFAGAISPRYVRGDIVQDDLFNHVLSVDSRVGTKQEKAALYKSTHKSIVDMETKYVAEKAENYSLPFMAIRVVTDSFKEGVPVDLLEKTYNQAKGKTTPIRMAWYLLRNPGKYKELQEFLEPLKALRVKLCEAVINYLETTDEPRPRFKDRSDRNIFPPEPQFYKGKKLGQR